MNSDLEEKLRSYYGPNQYLNTLRHILETDGVLNKSQILFAEKLLITHVIKSDDLSLLPEEIILDFKTDWGKYTNKSPFEFQKQDINWLLNKERAILGLDMGLGKSLITTIAAIESQYKKILIVCPASLKLNWRKEIETFANLSDISILDKKFTPAKFTIVNYESLPKFLKEIEKHKFELVIGDEAHYCKNLQSKRTKNFTKIANKAKRVWLLTGTPIANKPIDFYSLLKICKHELGKNKQAYGEQFCGGVKTFFGWDFNGASNLKRLHLKTKNVLLRRRKEDTLELPPKTRTPIYLELTNRKGYDNAVTEYLLKKQNELEAQLKLIEYELTGSLKNKEYTDKLVELSVLRKFTALEKIKDRSLFELVDDIIDQGKKIVIFTNYLDVIDTVKEHYKDDCLTLDGRLSLEERNERIDLFQSGKGPSIVVCNLAIASVGLTLTKATVGVMNDLSWSPSTMMQAEDRLYRISQENKVDIIYPVYDNTIDVLMFDVLKDKMFNINSAIEGKEEELAFTGDMFKEVYARLDKKGS